MKLKKWELALIFALAITFLCGAALSKEQTDLSEKLLRLHVVANSDSEADQALKLKVRDRILRETRPLLDGAASRADAVKIISKNLDKITAAAKEAVRAEGFGYDVSAKLAVEHFPTRDYETFSLPAGKYASLRVVIGSGEGRNWWCVVFPPLCTTAAMDEAAVIEILTEDQLGLITMDEPRYVIKFKSIELLEKFRSFLGI